MGDDVVKPVPAPFLAPPFSPPSGDDDAPPDPDNAKNLSYLVPDLHIAWGTAPSFNDDPPGEGGAGAPPKDITVSERFSVNLADMRNVLQEMLTAARPVVDSYETLRKDFESQKDTVWGQNATQVYNDPVVQSIAESPSTAQTEQRLPIQDYAHQFARELNPSAEKAMWRFANAMEVVGQFIAALDHAGQTYGFADRHSRFPPPGTKQEKPPPATGPVPNHPILPK